MQRYFYKNNIAGCIFTLLNLNLASLDASVRAGDKEALMAAQASLVKKEYREETKNIIKKIILRKLRFPSFLIPSYFSPFLPKLEILSSYLFSTQLFN